MDERLPRTESRISEQELSADFEGAKELYLD
jgi:hypothetical protein